MSLVCLEPVATMLRRQRAQRGRGLRQLGQLEDCRRREGGTE